MPAATPLPLRQQIFDLCQAGGSPSHVARSLALPERTVRRLAAHWLAAPGASLAPLPARGGHPLAAHPPPLLRYRVRRKVSRRGQVSAYHRLIQVGQQHGGCWVYLGLDAQTAEWVISDVQGHEIRRRPAAEFTEGAIMNLEVARQ